MLRIEVKNLPFEVNAGMQPPNTYYLPINDVMINAMNILSANGIDTADISSIRPSRATLSVVFQEDRLDYLDAVSVRLCPFDDIGTNCGREVFYRDPVPFDEGYELDLVPTSSQNDYQELVLQNALNVQVKFERLRKSPSGSYNITLNMEFEVR